MRLNGATLLLLFCIVFALFSATSSTELQERTPQRNHLPPQKREYRHHKARGGEDGGEHHHHHHKKPKKCRPKSKSKPVSSFSIPSTIPSGKSWHAQMLNPSVTIIILNCSGFSLFIDECYRESFEQCGNITFLESPSTIDRGCKAFIIDCDSAILLDSNRYICDANLFTNY